jgi:hypothetical protein
VAEQKTKLLKPKEAVNEVIKLCARLGLDGTGTTSTKSNVQDMLRVSTSKKGKYSTYHFIEALKCWSCLDQ